MTTCEHKNLSNSHCLDCRQRFLYDNGLPFNGKINNTIDSLKDRVETKKASLIIVDGGVGEGKTTLAVEIADYYGAKDIIFKDQLGYGGEKFQEKLRICIDKQLIVAIYDEAGDFSKRGALTKFNRMLNRLFETFRGFQVLVILCLPNFGVLDKTLFENKIPRLLIHCHSRTTKYGGYSAYSLYRMFWLLKKMKDLTVSPQAYNEVQPNYRGHFLDLFPKRSKELDIISTEEKENILTGNVLEHEGLLNLKEIGKELNRTTRWVRMKLKEYNIVAVREYKKTKYYDNSIVEVIG